MANQRRNAVLPIVALIALTGAIFTWANPSVGATNAERDLAYVPIDGSVFVQPHVIDGWINRPGGPNLPALNNHAWDLWKALNQPSGQKLNGTALPIWETWYSGEEVFLDKQEVKDPDDRDLDPLNQSIDTGELAVQTGNAPRVSTTVLSFNRYNRQMLDHIQQNHYYDRRVLAAMGSEFDLAGTPPAQRSVTEFPNTSVMLKPVWWIVPGDRASTMPYWAGGSPDVATDADNPMWKTWKQCVVVDPTGHANTERDRTCNKNFPGQTTMKSGSYAVKKVNANPSKSDFYAFRLNQSEVHALGQFNGILSNTNKEGTPEEVHAGDYALLVAMHVTTREIPNWTWETYWWEPDASAPPSLPPYSQTPPRRIPAPFDQFDMCTADFMTTPVNAGPAGEPWVCFNPYLETDLQGLVTPDRAVSTEVGIHSSCQTCHRAAKFVPSGKPVYAVHGFLDKNDPAWFKDAVNAEFLWSLALRAHDPPFSAPTPTPTAAAPR